MFETLQTANPLALFFGGVLALVGALIAYKTCGSSYAFALFLVLFVLTATAARFEGPRILCLQLRWPMLLLLAAAGLLPIRRAATSWRHAGVLSAAAVFLVLVFLSCFYSVYWFHSFKRALSFAAVAVAAYIGVYKRAAHPERLSEFMDVLYKLALVVTGIGVVMVFIPAGEAGGTRFSGFFRNPNGLGLFCSMLLPIAIWQHWERRRLGMRSRTYAAALVVAMAAFIFMSGSRGAFVSAFLASAFLLVILYGSRAALPVSLIIVIAVLAVLGSELLRSFLLERTEHLVRPERLPTLTHRIPLWKEAWPYIEERPLLGHGFGVSGYILYGPEIELAGLDPEQVYHRTLHSMHIQTAVDLGFVGVVFLWGLLIYIACQGIAIFLRKDESPERALAAALLACCAVVAMDTVIHGWLYSAGSQGALLFHVTFVCMLQASSQWRRRREREIALSMASEEAGAAGEDPCE